MASLRNHKHERFARERALLTPLLVAARAAGYDDMTAGNAAKIDRRKDVQARIKELSGDDETMIREKRQKIESRLWLAAEADILRDCTVINPVTKQPEIDWQKVMDSGLSVVVAGFKFDRETGLLVDFERDSALNAVSQLRDIFGFKAPSRAELTGKNGAPLVPDITDEQRAKALAVFMAKHGAGAAA